MPLQLDHIHLKGPDPRKSAQWYVDAFGAKVVREFDVKGALFIRLEIEGVPINLSGPRPGEQPGPGDARVHYGLEHFALSTDDLDGTMARLQQHGVAVLVPPQPGASGSKIAFIEAPDNVRIELIQWGEQRAY